MTRPTEDLSFLSCARMSSKFPNLLECSINEYCMSVRIIIGAKDKEINHTLPSLSAIIGDDKANLELK
jgi:hypothetical protein